MQQLFLILLMLCLILCEKVNASNVSSHKEVITQLITEIPSGGIVIDAPGYYVFGNNIK